MTSVSVLVSGRRRSTPPATRPRTWRRRTATISSKVYGAQAGNPLFDERQRLVRRPDAAGDEPLAAGIAARELIGGASRKFGSGFADFVSQFRELKLGERDRIGVERVRFDDVGAGFEILLMDAADEVRLRQHHHVGGVLQQDRMIFEPLAAIVLFGRLRLEDERGRCRRPE